MSENKYLELCNRVYSHIQSKDVREYYINEIKDSIEPDGLMFLIKYGYYPLVDKLNHMKKWVECTNIDNYKKYPVANSIVDDINKIYDDLHDDSYCIYIGGIDCEYENIRIYELFYGHTFDDVFTNLKSYISKTYNKLYFNMNIFSYGFIDKIHPNKSMTNFIRYRFDNVNGNFIITNADIHTDNIYNTEIVYPINTVYKYPFKNGDRVLYKTPLMSNAVTGIFESEIDGNGTYYAFISCDNGEVIDLANMFSVVDGYHSIDWIFKE